MALGGDDLASYLDRIGYTGPRRPDLPMLQGVVAAHAMPPSAAERDAGAVWQLLSR